MSKEKMLNSYKSETKSLVGNFDTPKSLQYYFRIAEKAYDFAKKFNEDFL